MEIFETLYNEIIGFLGISKAWEILQAGDFNVNRTYDGIVSLIYPLIPFLVLGTYAGTHLQKTANKGLQGQFSYLHL